MRLEGLHSVVFLQTIQSSTVCTMVERGGRYPIMWMAFFLAMAGDSGFSRFGIASFRFERLVTWVTG